MARIAGVATTLPTARNGLVKAIVRAPVAATHSKAVAERAVSLYSSS